MLDVLHAIADKRDWLNNPDNNKKPIELLSKVGGKYANWPMDALVKELAKQELLFDAALAKLKAEVAAVMNQGGGTGPSFTPTPEPYSLPRGVQIINVPTATTANVSSQPTAS